MIPAIKYVVPDGNNEMINLSLPVRETNTRPLTNVSAFWAGQVENRPGWVEFYIEHIRVICFQASAPKI